MSHHCFQALLELPLCVPSGFFAFGCLLRLLLISDARLLFAFPLQGSGHHPLPFFDLCRLAFVLLLLLEHEPVTLRIFPLELFHFHSLAFPLRVDSLHLLQLFDGFLAFGLPLRLPPPDGGTLQVPLVEESQGPICAN